MRRSRCHGHTSRLSTSAGQVTHLPRMCTAPSITTAYQSPMSHTRTGLYERTGHRKNICRVGPWQEGFCASREHGRQLKDAAVANFKAPKKKHLHLNTGLERQLFRDKDCSEAAAGIPISRRRPVAQKAKEQGKSNTLTSPYPSKRQHETGGKSSLE